MFTLWQLFYKLSLTSVRSLRHHLPSSGGLKVVRDLSSWRAQGKFSYKKLGTSIILLTTLTCGGALWLGIVSFQERLKSVTNVFDLERNIPYIYVDNGSESGSEKKSKKLRRSLRKYVKEKIKEKRVTWLPWLHAQSDDPLILLRLAQSGDRNIRLIGVEALAEDHDWEDFQFRNIAQACDRSTLVALARSYDVDERFFLPMPRLPQSEFCIEDEFRILLSSLPKQGVGKCVQHFTCQALHEGNIGEERGGLWCFGGTGLEFAKTLSPVPEEKVEIFCLEALLSHSGVVDHCFELVALGGLPLLQRVYQKRRNSLVIRRLIARILGNIAVHVELHNDIIRAGWISVLMHWLRSKDLSLSLHAARTLANLDRDFRPPVYHDGVYVIHPTCRDRSPVYADVVFVHGIMGGPFKTWRQQDKRFGPDGKIELEQYDKETYSFCWPKDWLAQDCPNLRILSVEYDTNLSDWNARCPFESEKRSLSVRGAAILEKLQQAGVGRRPVIWIGHSMGGLLIKQMLMLAQSNSNCVSMTKNTIGMVMFSVPHRGSSLAAYSKQARFLLYPSIEVKELSRDSLMLKSLHKSFQQFIVQNSIPCLSFGELEKLSIGGMRPLKLLIVPPESSDPGVGEFHTFPTNHLNICKPVDRDSDLYKLTLRFIRDCVRSNLVENFIRVGFAFQEANK